MKEFFVYRLMLRSQESEFGILYSDSSPAQNPEVDYEKGD